jgi:hypothetical protein
METIYIEAVTKFTSEIEKLRRTGFYGSSSETFSSDEFDTRSVHVLATIQDELVGMIRLTPEPPSILQKWSNGKAPIPNGEGVIDLTRGVVSKKWRNFDIFKLLICEAMIKAKDLGGEIAVASIAPHFPHRAFLTDIGFQNAGEPLIFYHLSAVVETISQCVIHHPQEDFDKVIDVRTKIINGVRMRKLHVISSISKDSVVV